VKRAGLVVAFCLVTGCGTAQPSASPSTTIVLPDQEPVSIQPAATLKEDPVWRRVELPDADGALNSIAVQGDDIVIVGALEVDRPMAWSAHKGDWTSEKLPADAGVPFVATKFGDRVLVAGGMETSRCAHPAQTTFVVRDAARRWTAAPFAPLFCAASGSLDVAISGEVAGVLGSGVGDQPVAWFSRDGLHWVDSGLKGELFPKGLATHGEDFVALGLTSDRWWFGRARGVGGWQLTVVAGLPDPAVSALHGFVDGGDGVVAWFGGDEGEDVAYTSANGEVWRKLSQDGLSGMRMLRVKRIGGGFAAIAERAEGQVMLRSVDATSWREIPRPLVMEANGIFRDFVVAGQSMYLLMQTQGDAPIWLLRADEGALGF
jgi:hypothetical protein